MLRRKLKLGQAFDCSDPMSMHRVVLCAVRNLSQVSTCVAASDQCQCVNFNLKGDYDNRDRR